ncbi:tetracycline resistance MFS efflux pump [Capsulimonas corticalis]|uniref:Tetracycline resistance MFS efflux pump n=1 Tax=Capsulimonas corticalis TaxID=2219043 RepID=A0A402D039_9BACT|nr:MFS transporter [Capsulimonas corticalis]BDI33802.1 tetracycline resistance MFS efflux pump [Capsulimonas corticalis]
MRPGKDKSAPTKTDAKPAKKPSSPEYREMHTKLGLLAIAVIINVLGFSIIIPLVPYFIKEALGPGVSAADPRIGEYGGWLTAVYALMQFVFAPIWGRLSDKIGRKPLLMLSLAGDVVFYTMFGLSHSLTMLFAARILAGIFSSATLAIAQAYAADVTPPEHRAAGLGMIGASFGVGFVFGPALGGPLGAVSLALPLFVSAGLAFANLLYIWKYLPEPSRERAPAPSAAVKTSRLAMMGRAVFGPLGFLYILTFAVTFAFANLEGTFSAYLMQHFGYTKNSSLKVQGGVYAYLGFLIVLIQGGAIRPLVKRYGEPRLVIAGIALMAAGFLIFPFCNSLGLLMIGPMIPIACGNGLNSPALRALISRKTSAHSQGASLGLSASFDSLARATGPAAAGWLYRHQGMQSPYWCAGIVMTCALLFAVANYHGLAAPDAAPAPVAGEGNAAA